MAKLPAQAYIKIILVLKISPSLKCVFILYPFIKVEKLCNRVTSATLLADRRDALRALKSLSKVCSVLTVSVVFSDVNVY